MKEEITDTGSIEEKLKPGGSDSGTSNLLEVMKLLKEMQDRSVVKKPINSELWHACSGPLVTLPTVGSLVYYFPQGHSEQVAVSTNRAATTQISNFSDLSSQLLCQVLNVTLHADRETDEIYAQMSLQTVNSEKDVFPIPDFGLKPSKYPAEVFCKTLTVSDTSTHGGFSVPRRAAEKLFPRLDYSMQPPTQELLVRDLHDNTWTFRHIYRGQPKRHLLTTGWSMFVGAKRLRAGDAVLFTRDEKSQLFLGVRRANGQHTAFPSSVLSADSMHIGILAAAAQAAANRSPFTIFYNPRACPSQFVIPFSKYRKAVHGTQLSIGTRFGMMFETEDSTKMRYMGTIIRMSDLDPLRWPNSKWRSLQVEWDETGCSDRPNRVSPWEIETPESIFVFPSLTTNLKRPFHSAFIGAHTEWGTSGNRPFLELQYPSIRSQWSDQLMKMLTKPHGVSTSGNASQCFHEIKEVALQEPVSLMQAAIKQKPELLVHDASPRQCHPQSIAGQRKITNSDVLLAGKLASASNRDNLASSGARSELPKLEPVLATSQSSLVQSEGQLNEEKLPVKPVNPHNLINDFAVTDQNNGMTPLQTSSCITQSQLEARTLQTQNADPSILESASASALLQYLSQGDFNTYPMACPPLSESVTNPGSSSMSRKSDQFSTSSETVCPLVPSVSQELWDYHSNYSQPASLPVLLPHQDALNLQHSSCGLQDLSDVNCYQRDLYSCPTLDGDDSGSTAIDPSVSNTVLDDFCTLNKVDLPNPSDYLVENLCSTQDVQSQITSASLADSQTFSVQGYADNSGGASSSNLDFEDNHVLQQSSFQQVTPRFRTYTKIQKAGSVGRSIDVSSFKNYSQLLSEIERMFGLEGLLNDTCSEWKLVYVDFENDVLLVGDDPWEEFVGCVRCIRILSPSEFKKMGEEGMQLLNSAGIHAASGPTLEVGCSKNGFS